MSPAPDVLEFHVTRNQLSLCEVPLMRSRSWPITQQEFGRPRRITTMNETVYLFALSLPALLDRIVADQDEAPVPLFQPQSPAPRK
jgi:hypothetical protein